MSGFWAMDRLSILMLLTLPCLALGQVLSTKPSGKTGVQSVLDWKKDWPGCQWEDGVSEGHLSVTKRDGKSVWRVDYAIGGIGPEKGGVGWRWPLRENNSAQLTYTLRFSPGFDWVKGGKLPGLSGGPSNTSGGRPADGTNGFSARLMWRRDGRGEAYVYHMDQQDKYGDSFPFPEDFRFPMDQAVRLRLRVTMNTPGKKDGKLYVYLAPADSPKQERLLVARTNMQWRSVESFAVDSLYFESFHGGNDNSWAPTKPCWAEFSDIKVTLGEK
jgi:hypothetical protein